MNDNSSYGGIGFLQILTIVFIALKLTNVITWSWFWVLSPMIFSIVIILVVMALIVIFGQKHWRDYVNK